MGPCYVCGMTTSIREGDRWYCNKHFMDRSEEKVIDYFAQLQKLSELLKTPNLDKSTINTINRAIEYIVEQLYSPAYLIKEPEGK